MPDDKNIGLNNPNRTPEPKGINIDNKEEYSKGENQAKEEQVINNTEDPSNNEIDLAKEVAEETPVQKESIDSDLTNKLSRKDIGTEGGADVLGQEIDLVTKKSEVDLTTQEPKVENPPVPEFQNKEELPMSAEKSTGEVLPPKIDESQIQPEKPVEKAIQPQTTLESTDLEPTEELGRQVSGVPTKEEISGSSIPTPPLTPPTEEAIKDNRNWFQKLFGIGKKAKNNEEPHPVSQEAVKTGDTSTMEEIAATGKGEIGQNEEIKK